MSESFREGVSHCMWQEESGPWYNYYDSIILEKIGAFNIANYAGKINLA